MIANPAISAGVFPGSNTGNQEVRRVVQDGLGICVIVFQYNAGACRVNPFPMNGTGREPGDIGAAGGNGDRRQSWQQVVVVNVAAGGDTTHVVMKPGWRRSRGREAVGAEMLSRHDEEIRTRAAVWGTAMVAGESSGCI